ncbi:MAG: co-chaperone GroES [Bdellovibrionia bacterium]
MAKAKKKSAPSKKVSKKSAPKAQNKSKIAAKTKAAKAPKAKASKAKASAPKAKAVSSVKATAPFAARPKPRTGPVGISPVRSRVIVRRDESEERTAGGLYIPDAAKDKPLMGRVVAVGTGSFNKKGVKKPLDVKVGDHIVFNRYTGSEITVDGEGLLVIEEREIIGIVQD